ncbi:hypothetical protein [Pseudogemmobacter sonorensis]|uniref:hypothetical protein n=1 Tax=Pseudogemmobacter sonorensis TaxID=2989681 RepID=UPI003699CC32
MRGTNTHTPSKPGNDDPLAEVYDALTLILDATTGSPGFQMIREIRRYAEAARNQTHKLMEGGAA